MYITHALCDEAPTAALKEGRGHYLMRAFTGENIHALYRLFRIRHRPDTPRAGYIMPATRKAKLRICRCPFMFYLFMTVIGRGMGIIMPEFIEMGA